MGIGEQPSIRREKDRIVAKRRFYLLTDVAFCESKKPAFGCAKGPDFFELCSKKSGPFFKKGLKFFGARRACSKKI